MLRPLTSNVSALSGFVAKSHQALHFVSSAPSKIPYGGFSPVRLQTRLRPRPPSPAPPRWLIGRHCRYLRPRRLIRSRACAQAAPRTSDHDRESSGPWLPHRLFCPAGSSLTMATSAPLRATRRLMSYSVRLRVQSASRRGSPIYSASPFTPCRRPYSGGPRDCVQRCLHRRFCLHPLCTGSATTCPTAPNQVGCVTKLQHSLNATAWGVARPASARAFTTELSRVGSPLPVSVMTGWFIVIYHRRTFTGWTGSLMGCEQRRKGAETQGVRLLGTITRWVSHVNLFFSRHLPVPCAFASWRLCVNCRF